MIETAYGEWKFHAEQARLAAEKAEWCGVAKEVEEVLDDLWSDRHLWSKRNLRDYEKFAAMIPAKCG